MSDRVVNLNRRRKAVQKARNRAKADENAVKFGRTKAEKAADKAESADVSKTLDGAKRET
ncbi:MAG: DUF4169 family protein [Pseudomonadota bacterium]